MIRKIIRLLYRNILPFRVKTSVDLFEQLRSRDLDNSKPATKEDLKEKNVLVLAPHPDDDIIGCGGTLNMYRQNGATITVVYMTDGRKGKPAYDYDEDTLVSERREEARKAAAIIGIDKLLFLDNRDSELSATPKTILRISDILSEVKPEAVFLPFLLDNHMDHKATNDIFVMASREYNSNILCYGYEIWTPITTPNYIVDITEDIETKKRALAQHRSQLILCPLIDASLSLSRYRCILHSLKDGYAEAFFQCTAAEYRRLWQVIQ